MLEVWQEREIILIVDDTGDPGRSTAYSQVPPVE